MRYGLSSIKVVDHNYYLSNEIIPGANSCFLIIFGKNVPSHPMLRYQDISSFNNVQHLRKMEQKFKQTEQQNLSPTVEQNYGMKFE